MGTWLQQEAGLSPVWQDRLLATLLIVGGLWLAQDDNFNNGWPGYIYYVPSYTSLATLPSMNDSITSLKHDLP